MPSNYNNMTFDEMAERLALSEAAEFSARVRGRELLTELERVRDELAREVRSNQALQAQVRALPQGSA